MGPITPLSPLASLALRRLEAAPKEESLELARNLDTLLRQTDLSQGNLSALAVARLSGSTTLFKETYRPGQGIAQWNLANEFVLKSLGEGKILSGGLILGIYESLSPGSTFREISVSGGNSKYPEVTDLEYLWKVFEARLGNVSLKPPIIAAAEVYQWLVTLHFFPDANGRLARLSSDFILLSAGLIPVSFPNDAASFASALAEPVPYTVDDAIRIISQGLEHSLSFFQRP